jgi:hypothetical protein
MSLKELYVTEWHSLDIAQKASSDDDSSSSSGSSSGQKKKDYTCQNKFVVRAFCLTDDGRSVALDIHDFQPYFYIKVPY